MIDSETNINPNQKKETDLQLDIDTAVEYAKKDGFYVHNTNSEDKISFDDLLGGLNNCIALEHKWNYQYSDEKNSCIIKECHSTYIDAGVRSDIAKCNEFMVCDFEGFKAASVFYVQDGKGKLKVLFDKQATTAEISAGDFVVFDTSKNNSLGKSLWFSFESDENEELVIRRSITDQAEAKEESRYYQMRDFGAKNRRSHNIMMSSREERVRKSFERLDKRRNKKLGKKAIDLSN